MLRLSFSVVLQQNIWAEAVLVNGEFGIIRNILYRNNEESSRFEMLPACVLVASLCYHGPGHLPMSFLW